MHPAQEVASGRRPHTWELLRAAEAQAQGLLLMPHSSLLCHCCPCFAGTLFSTPEHLTACMSTMQSGHARSWRPALQKALDRILLTILQHSEQLRHTNLLFLTAKPENRMLNGLWIRQRKNSGADTAPQAFVIPMAPKRLCSGPIKVCCSHGSISRTSRQQDFADTIRGSKVPIKGRKVFLALPI